MKELVRDRTFEEICRMSQKGVKRYARKELTKLGYVPVIEDGFVYAKGEVPVLLVAHMDTVHKENVKHITYKDDEISSPQGIGGDDRCGIYMILDIIKEINCSVLFTEDEEIGCVGAHKFTESDISSGVSVNYIIEFDRKGNNDAVFYDCDNPDFTEFIESTGFFKEASGSVSDISYVAPHLGVSAVNLSCGYYKAHTVKETVKLLEMYKVIEEAKKLILTEVAEPYEYIEAEKWSYGSGYGYGGYSNYDYNYGRSRYVFPEYYHIYWFDEEDEYYGAEVLATSEAEAIGKFLMENPTLCYENISNVFSEDDYAEDDYYIPEGGYDYED